ncbi:ATP-binding protein [Uliginosibacterium sp. H3]|uniref:histidine kinase n=1 Tax=Uliginosibacterium silvisoli TaxID=3114758 RepID=A0ABU6K158_9RHOO|nr:ATP-binding protein [Uliginosibacterium sp. H3]
MVDFLAGIPGSSVGVLVVGLAPSLLFLGLWLDERHKRIAAQHLAALRREDLAHSTRLVTVGELTGSIAHEISQPLGAILSNAEAADVLLSQKPLQTEELRHILYDIRADDLRASKIVRQIRALLTKSEQKMSPLSLNELVAETLLFVQGAIRRANARLCVEYADTSVLVCGDRTQLQQVLMNLLLNALDAMKDTPAPNREMILRTRVLNGAMHCEVLDRGHGIVEEHRGRIFESFFTTKPGGLGLGLTISRSIMERHDGSITLADRQGGGVVAGFVLKALPEPEESANTSKVVECKGALA